MLSSASSRLRDSTLLIFIIVGIPKTNSQMINLVSFDLSSNSISGSLPVELSNVIALFSLHINRNMLYGELPSTLYSITRLDEVYIQGHSLSGNITSMATLSGLWRLYISRNDFTGTLERFGELNSLEVGRFEYIHINGTIPETFPQMDQLSECKVEVSMSSECLL